MAKIKIHLNGTDYNIDESALADVMNNLKTHFSTTMSGTGAAIEFDGATYNIDSTKLATATNNFIAHLGTIAGEGLKIVVGGVEYGIDSSKVTGALSEFESVLGGLSSGGESDSNVITWDGTVGDRVNIAIPDFGGLCVKVSDKIFTAEGLVGSTATLSVGQSAEISSDFITPVDGAIIVADGLLLSVSNVNVNVMGISYVFPETGTYFINKQGMYIASLTLPS